MLSLLHFFSILVFYVHANFSDFDIWSFPSNVVVSDVAASPFDGYIYVVGSTTVGFDNQTVPYNPSVSINHSGYLSCLDRTGNFIWTKFFGDGRFISTTAISIDAETGDIYVGGVGHDSALDTGNSVYPYVGRFLSNGTLIYMNYFTTSYDYIAPFLKKLRIKRIGSTVYVVASGADSTYSFLKIFDQNGKVIASNILTLHYGSADGLAIGKSLNEIYQSQLTNNFLYPNLAIQVFFSGLTLNYQIQSPHDAQAIFFLNDTLYVTGQTKQSSSGVAYSSTSQYDIIVSKFDTNGNLNQSVIFGGNDQDTPADLLVHPVTGDIFVCGTTLSKFIDYGINHGSKDAFVAKLDSNLTLIWVKLIGWNFDDYALTMNLHSNDRIYMAMQMNFTGTSSDYCVISFDSALIDPVFILTSNSPSVFTSFLPSTLLSSSTLQSHVVEIKSGSTVVDNLVMTLSLNSSTKTSPVTKKIPQAFQGSSLDSTSYFWPTIIGICVTFFLILILIVSRIYFNQRKGKLMDLTKQSTEMTTTTTTGTDYENSSSYSSSLVQTTTSTSIFSETLSTQMVTQNVYSIPGFLKMKKEDLRPLKEITKGGQGTILIAEVLNSQYIQQYKVKQVILKSTDLDFEQLTERQQNCFNQELAIIQYFKEQPGFVKLYGYILEPACLVMKFYPLGNMENLVQRKGQYFNLVTTKHFVIFFVKELSQTIFFLHDAGFVHCDIKPQNILLEADQSGVLHPILTDFGITQVVSSKVLKVKAMTVENLKGFSLFYAAPEQILQLRGEIKSLSSEKIKGRDIYAIAGLLYGLMMKTEPWQSFSSKN